MNTNQRYRVEGFGRVGSYTSAKRGHRSRARQYWTLVEWSDECGTYCKTAWFNKDQHRFHYPVGWIEVAGAQHFKTKKAATEFFATQYPLE